MKGAAIVSVFLAISLMVVIPAGAWFQGPEGHAAYLYPVVRIEAPGGVGSGTIIYSEPCEDGKGYHTYVITNQDRKSVV